MENILGDQYTRSTIKQIGKNSVSSYLQTSQNNSIGSVQTVPIELIVSDDHYNRRLEVLLLLDRGFIQYLIGIRKTKYYKTRKGAIKKIRNLTKYYRLFKSIKMHGLIEDTGKPASLPWLFISQECVCRLDGHHRASIARFLGYKKMKVMAISPDDLLSNIDLNKEQKQLMNNLHALELAFDL